MSVLYRYVIGKSPAVLATLFAVQTIVLHLVQSQDLEVISTQLPCPDVQRPVSNERWCYRTSYSMTPPLPIYECNAAIIPKTNRTVKFVDSLDNNIFTEDGIPQTKLWSPNKIQGRNYQANRYCLYKATCPPGHFMYYSWLDGNFDLEPEKDGLCLDYVFIHNFDKPSEKLCGSKPKFVDQRSAPLELTFRSNSASSTRYPGFRIDILCVSPLFANLPNCTLLNTTYANSENTSDSVPTARKKRGATLTYIPQTLNSINIPRDGYILYVNNVVKVVADGRIQRVFRDIKYFFFWTGFKGTLALRTSAPRDLYIFGGGNLKVLSFLYTAFYSTVRIPPEFEPSEEAVQAISMLLNATTPFFLEDDPLDVEDEPLTTTLPPTTNPPRTDTSSPIRYYDKRAAARLAARKRGRRARRQVGSGAATDQRVNPDTLSMAESLENACDVFLREAARSYLRILQEFGIRTR